MLICHGHSYVVIFTSETNANRTWNILTLKSNQLNRFLDVLYSIIYCPNGVQQLRMWLKTKTISWRSTFPAWVISNDISSLRSPWFTWFPSSWLRSRNRLRCRTGRYSLVAVQHPIIPLFSLHPHHFPRIIFKLETFKVPLCPHSWCGTHAESNHQTPGSALYRMFHGCIWIINSPTENLGKT